MYLGTNALVSKVLPKARIMVVQGNIGIRYLIFAFAHLKVPVPSLANVVTERQLKAVMRVVVIICGACKKLSSVPWKMTALVKQC